MLASQRWMDVVANNLANLNTAGFKQDGIAFNDSLVRELRANGGFGLPIGSLGSGAQETAEGTDFSEGSITQTGNPLDLAIEGDKGMLAVQAPGGTRYTRDGELAVLDGRLSTKDGYAVLDDSGSAISLDPSKTVQISEDGSVSQGGKPVAKLGLYDGSYLKEGGNLFSSTDAKAIDMTQSDAPRIKQGAVEGSNVSATRSMIDMIQLGRNFELAQKSMQTQDELTQRLIESLQS